jgi:ankyrin repeat protein
MFGKNNQKFRTAAANNNLKTCLELLSTVDINSSGPDSGKTALHWAAEKGNLDIVQLLLDNGAKLKKDRQGFTPYDWTENPQISRLISYHFKEYFMTNPLTDRKPMTYEEAETYGFTFDEETVQEIVTASQSNDLGRFSFVLKKHQVSVNSYVSGLPLLVMAYLNPDLARSFVDYFIAQGVNLNLKAHRKQRDAYQGTLLHGILANENVDLALYILEKAMQHNLTIDSTIRDVEGKTIVLMGVLLRHVPFVSKCLMTLDKGAVNIPDSEGRTPLHYAYLFGHKAMIDLLQKHGASMEYIDKTGNKPIDMLYVEEEVIISTFKKFHIDPIERLVHPHKTLLQKCLDDVDDRVKEIMWSNQPALD